MYPFLLLILAIGFGILAWTRFRDALFVLAALLPVYLLRFSFGPIPSTLLEIFLLLTIAVWLVKGGYKTFSKSLRDPWVRAGLLLLAAASFGVVVAPNTIEALGIWKAYFVEPFLLFFVLRDTLKTGKDWRMLFAGLGVGAIAVSLFAVFQVQTGLALPAPWDLEHRATGFFPYPNALGLFVAPIVAASAVLAFLKPKERLFWGAVAVLGFLGIFLAQTEAAFVAVPAALLLTFFFSSAKTRTKKIVAPSAILVLFLLFTIPGVQTKLLLQDYSGETRRAQWTETIQLLQDKPFFGAGLGGYPTALEPYHDPTFYEIFQYPHNLVLNIWSELGLLGLVAFAWLAWLTVQAILKRHHSPVALAAFTALAVMTIHGLVDVPYFKNDLAVMTWIFLAGIAQATTAAPSLRQSA